MMRLGLPFESVVATGCGFPDPSSWNAVEYTSCGRHDTFVRSICELTPRYAATWSNVVVVLGGDTELSVVDVGALTENVGTLSGKSPTKAAGIVIADPGMAVPLRASTS